MSKPHAHICPPPEAGADWDRLAACAAPNVFMSPAALLAAREDNPRLHVIAARNGAGEGAGLVGLWALRKTRLARLGPAVLSAPPYDYSFVSNPVVDPEHMEAAVAAFFQAIATDPALPSVVRLKDLDADTETYRAIEKVAAAQNLPVLMLAEHVRPFATRTAGLKTSGSTRKKLRQDWNRLAEQGAVDIVNESAGAPALQAFETFLAMEAASWKGGNGTALLSCAADAKFVRHLFRELAQNGGASVALLRVDGRAIAAQVLLYSGRMAYTWKTAFDSAFAKYSPGALLVDKVTEKLFASDGIDAIESCSPEKSFMSQLWSGRRRTVDLLIDVSGKRSLGFLGVMVWEQGYRRLRALRNELRASAWLPDPRRRPAT